MKLVEIPSRCRAWAGRHLKKTRKQQHPPCALLELPLDAVLLIAEQLPRQSQLVLAQTCRPLQVAVRRFLHRPGARLSRDEHLDYLACLARDLPNKWVCEECVGLHDVVLDDVPLSDWRKPKKKCEWLLPHVLFWSEPRAYEVHHRHVQLALKYTRARDKLNIRHRAYLERLLAPVEDVSYHNRARPGVIPIRFSACPRVVGGRFLLLATWRYTKTDTVSISPEVLDYMGLCKHQFLYWARMRIFPFPWELRRLPAIISTLTQAFEAPGDAEARGACPRCPVDFAAQASPDRVVLRVWWDLGPEDSPTDAVWQSLTSDHVEVSHRPGSVRELFESGG